MKKLFITTSILLFISPTYALTPYTPNEKEIKGTKYLISDDISGYFDNMQSAYKYGDYIFTTATELEQEYDKNEVRADKKFKGKNLIVSGVVESIQSDMLDNPFVVFKSKKNLGLKATEAKFDKSAYDQVIELNKKDKIELVCVGEGEVMGSPMLKDCKFKTDIVAKTKEKYLSAYDDLLQNGINEKNKFINRIVFSAIRINYMTNNFSKCKNEINQSCLNKSFDPKKEKEIKKAYETREFLEQHKPLAEYLEFQYRN